MLKRIGKQGKDSELMGDSHLLELPKQRLKVTGRSTTLSGFNVSESPGAPAHHLLKKDTERVAHRKGKICPYLSLLMANGCNKVEIKTCSSSKKESLPAHSASDFGIYVDF